MLLETLTQNKALLPITAYEECYIKLCIAGVVPCVTVSVIRTSIMCETSNLM